MRAISLAITLFVFWLLLSGHYTGFLIGVGMLSAAFCTWVALRMKLVDVEGFPAQVIVGFFTYLPWLIWEIAKSTWVVTGIVLRGPDAISPSLIKVRASQKSQIGINFYANSITLTPGTITVDVEGDEFTVHALTQATADDLVEGTMDRRVVRMEGIP